jgi:hypothetical protein
VLAVSQPGIIGKCQVHPKNCFVIHSLVLAASKNCFNVTTPPTFSSDGKQKINHLAENQCVKLPMRPASVALSK